MKKRIAICFFALMPMLLIGQDSYRFGAIPVLNFNVKLKQDFSLNFKLENRHIFSRGTFEEGAALSEYEFERQDVETLLAKKISANSSLAGGYMLRIEDGNTVHRISQQFAISQPMGKIRIAHRFKADQTFDPSEPFELRLRYRLGSELALFGEKLDPNELYLKTTLEYLARFQEGFRNELRALPALGYLAPNKNAFELGLDYRVSSNDEFFADHGFWIYLGWYLRFQTKENA